VDDSSVTVVTIGGNEYFQITGLGNAGGFSTPNNTPTDLQIGGSNGSAITENLSTTNLGAFAATDSDTGETHTFSLACTVAGADDAHFSISDNQLQNITTFNYEDPVDANGNNIYEVCVVANDGNGGLYEETITVTITNIDDGLLPIRGGSRSSAPTAPVTETTVPDEAVEEGSETDISTMEEEKSYVEGEICSHPFEDVAGNWAEEHIKYLYCEGIINGRTGSEFMPEDEITRTEFLKILLLTFGYDIPEENISTIEMIFSDIEEESWYTPYVYTAYEGEIIDGYSHDGTFKPYREITQAEALKMLLMAAGDEVKEGEETAIWYEKYIKLGMEKGIFTEFTNPEGKILRSEAVKLMSEYLKNGEVVWSMDE
jgi:hypothetical protein